MGPERDLARVLCYVSGSYWGGEVLQWKGTTRDNGEAQLRQWGEHPGCSGRGHSQAVGCPRKDLHSLVEHLETHLPVVPVGVAIEEQSIERSTECEVVLSP